MGEKSEIISRIYLSLYLYFSPRAKRDDIYFNVEIEENLPKIIGDGDRIKQVCINLLDNAFKFTDEKGCVGLKVFKSPENYIEIIVKDNGCGISEDELPKIKEKFYKGKNSKSQNGIGLSICDEIIKYHEGTLSVVSKLNEGTTVIAKIPITNNEG